MRAVSSEGSDMLTVNVSVVTSANQAFSDMSISMVSHLFGLGRSADGQPLGVCQLKHLPPDGK